MMEHLGGPESTERIVARQARYEQPNSNQFKIVDQPSGEGVGWVGFWEREWQGEAVYEIGWSVIPAFQGRGLAVAATSQAIAIARSAGHRRFLHAFPSVDNVPSNAICRKLGFALRGVHDVEYPEGNPMQINDWRLDLFSDS
jgi:RimJ/RimL family protein N-acetyltransferase